MTNKPHRATLPEGRGSESAATAQDTDRPSEQKKENSPSAKRAPNAGLPQWPALGARWQYGGSCSSEIWDNKISRGKLTETTWTRIGLRPNLKGHSTSTDKKQPPRVHSTDPPPTLLPNQIGNTRESFSRPKVLRTNPKHRNAGTFLRA